MYHSIAPGHGSPKWRWAISYDRFIEQLDLLNDAGWATARVSDLKNPGILKPRTVFITFDDGYADNYAAFEALAARQMVASWFMVAGHIGARADWPGSEQATLSTLSVSQLHEMQAAGMEIGAHGCRHLKLDAEPSESMRREVSQSKEMLEAVLGTEVTSFAYPYGRYDNRVIAAVKQAGFQFACSCRSGWAHLDFNPYDIRRIAILNNDTAGEFVRKLGFASNEAGITKLMAYYAGRIRARITRVREERSS